MNHHLPPPKIYIADDHPILGMVAMMPLVLHHPRSSFDEENLLQLLRHSVSLTLEEKISILLKIAQMSQKQVDCLERMLIDEQEKIEFITCHFPDLVAALLKLRMEEIAAAVESTTLSYN